MEDEKVDMNNFDLSKFLETISDSDSDFEEFIPKEKPGKNITTEIIKEVTTIQTKNQLTFAATSKVCKLMNIMPNTTMKLPIDIRTIKTLAEKKFDYNIFVICDECDELNANQSVCACGRLMSMDSKKNNFVVHFPLEIQLRLILDKYFDVLIQYLNRDHKYDEMSDIDDGKLYKKIRKENPYSYILSMTMNLDGATIFNSSRGSLWPVQLYLNFLPPEIRFLSENIISSTIYFGPKKPNISNLLCTLAMELDELNEKMIIIYKKNQLWNFIPILIQCVCDLPARAEVQCFKGPTGKNGCSYCHHPGVPIKNLSKRTTIRYTKQITPPQLRTHDETIMISQRISAENFSESGEKDSLKGIKGQSALFLFDYINIIDSVPTDYMHGVLLGVMKHLLEIWLGTKRIPQPPYKSYKITSVAERKRLDQRILAMKPYANFSRKPRSIFDLANFKAIEIQNLMWYYLRYALVGILPNRLIKNFEKLSAAIYMLCKKKIKSSEIILASEMLIDFSNEFEDIYGSGAVTMNIHLLVHYREIIENCGPLWCYAMFGFENNIGQYKKYVCGKTDVLSQIAHKYVLEETNPESKIVYENQPSFHQPLTINVEEKYFSALGSKVSGLNIWRRAKINKETYSSTYAHVTKSIDYFVKIRNDHFGKIVFFFECKSNPKLMLHVYKETYTNFHWTEVTETDTYKTYFTHEIEEKLLYFKVGSIAYFSRVPNAYGRACW